MSDVAIRVKGVGKQYRLGAERERYSTLGDQIRKLTSLRGLLRRKSRSEKRPPFWALKDVSFEVKRGEVVGIIGRNGAGKSTLLKILSQITEPTEGEIDLHGRVGSLLEVGTGFHPELTGRENIFLNGAILGMRRSEVARKFDDIVAFAEVEKFVDTAVKHYSSGMYMRLAFGVAAHLDPEILIVDEVLAVGDAQFQQKCLGKMGEAAKGGRTVLFVSHNMAAISLLCKKVIVMHAGAVHFIGPTQEGIARYFHNFDIEASKIVVSTHRPGSGEARFVGAHPVSPQFRPDEPKRINFSLRWIDSTFRRCHLSAHLVDQYDHIICQCDSRFLDTGISNSELAADIEGELTITQPWLKPGEYSIDLFLVDTNIGVIDRYEKACRFQVLPILPYAHSAPEACMSSGQVLGDFAWSVHSR